MKEEFIKTGIEGLDQLLDGGIRPYRSILIEGGPGTGKSTLGFQFLVNGAIQMDTHGVLVSMEYEVNDIINDMSSFGWPIQELLDQNKIRIVTPPGGFENPEEIDVDEMINFIYHHVNEIGAERLVIDSLNSLEISMNDGHLDRRELLRFITLVRDLGCTTLFLSEDYNDNRNNMYSYMTHGVIKLYYIHQGASRIRAIEVLKMRGVNHSNLTHSMNIQSGKGIVILPHEVDLKL